MMEPWLIVVLGILGVAGIMPAGALTGFGALMPWAYPRDVLGVRTLFGDRLGWLPGVDGRPGYVETAIATLVVLGLGLGMLAGSLLLIPTTTL